MFTCSNTDTDDSGMPALERWACYLYRCNRHLAPVAEPQINHSDKEGEEKMALSYDDFRNILTGQEKKITTGDMVVGSGRLGGRLSLIHI